MFLYVIKDLNCEEDSDQEYEQTKVPDNNNYEGMQLLVEVFYTAFISHKVVVLLLILSVHVGAYIACAGQVNFLNTLL